MNKNDTQAMLAAINEIQQPRSEFEIRNFVVNFHDTEPRRYQQAVLELSIKYDALRTAKIDVDIMKLEIAGLEKKSDKISKLKAQKKQIELEQLMRAMLGAAREFETLYIIWSEFPHKYTRAEIEETEHEYWQARLTRQAQLDYSATGRISAGNMDSLRMMGIDAKLPEPPTKKLESK